MSDYKGRLYSKAAILQALIQRVEKSNTKDNSSNGNGSDTKDTKDGTADDDNGIHNDGEAKDPIAHIKSLKDVVEIHFSSESKNAKDTNSNTNSSHKPLPTPQDDSNKNTHKEGGPESWICPASQEPILEASKGSKFIYLVPCGHVFAESAYKVLNFTQCFVCDASPLDKENGVVVLNPANERDVKAAEDRYKRLGELKLTHSLVPVKKPSKKSKKEGKKDSKKRKDVDGDGNGDALKETETRKAKKIKS